MPALTIPSLKTRSSLLFQGIVWQGWASNKRFAIKSAAKVWSRQRHLETGQQGKLGTHLISWGKCQRYFCSTHCPKGPAILLSSPCLFVLVCSVFFFFFFLRPSPSLQKCSAAPFPKIRLLHKQYIKNQPPKENSATEYKTQLLQSCTVTASNGKQEH